MIEQTRGIVLRSIKYGETSLIVNIFTERYGVVAYLVQGVRNAKAKQQRAGLLQPATLLDLTVYHKPGKNLQRIREYQPAYIYQNLQEEVVKNSIALFSVEVLLKLLPEQAPMPEVFDFVIEYFKALDKLPVSGTGNFPIYFIAQLSRFLGYEIQGAFSAETPHLNLQEGAFTASTPSVKPFVSDDDARALSELLNTEEFSKLDKVELNSAARFRLLDWYIEFLHQHTQHMGSIKSLAVLQAILH
ncbi:MAG: DNA repair protein RecO [Sphingobacteriales bacterium]|nr:MAG: DNA repair protein RecO [Sphingobacteriales bacterium]